MAAKKRPVLVSNSRLRKKFTKVTIYFDDTYMTFELSEWDMHKDYDWIEMTKKDDTVMECFHIACVARVSFSSDTVKEVKTDVLTLKPIA